MDLGYGTHYDDFREPVRTFRDAHWPPPETGSEGPSPEQIRSFRRLAIDAGYLYRNIPRRYGGSERAADILAAQIHPTRGLVWYVPPPLSAPRRPR